MFAPLLWRKQKYNTYENFFPWVKNNDKGERVCFLLLPKLWFLSCFWDKIKDYIKWYLYHVSTPSSIEDFLYNNNSPTRLEESVSKKYLLTYLCGQTYLPSPISLAILLKIVISSKKMSICREFVSIKLGMSIADLTHQTGY